MSHSWGAHNETACDYLRKGVEWPDWEVTLAFYSAAQFIKGTIFPMKLRQETFNSWEEYQVEVKKLRKSRHEALGALCDRFLKDASVAYRTLKDEANYCRYVTYQVSRKRAEKAREYLGIVKKACMAEVERREKTASSKKTSKARKATPREDA